MSNIIIKFLRHIYVDFYLVMVIKLFTEHLRSCLFGKDFLRVKIGFFEIVILVPNYFCTDLQKHFKDNKKYRLLSYQWHITSGILGWRKDKTGTSEGLDSYYAFSEG